MNFPGNTKEAMMFYKEVFKTPEPEIMYFKEIPPDDDFPITPEIADMVMHGSLELEGSTLMFSDIIPDMRSNFIMGNNLQMFYSSKDFNELKVLFETFAIKGKITTPFEATFWSKGYGAVLDQFGVEWQFNCDEE
jgi:PhnB protein